MTSLRYRLEQQLWAAGVKVGVLPSDTDAPQVQTFPVFLPHGVTMADIDRVLPEIAGRLALPPLRSLWRDDGLLELQVPKGKRQTVALDGLSIETDAAIPWLLGTDTKGRAIAGDIAEFPHGLIAGTTGSGKSTAVNAALCHLLAVRTPLQVRTVYLDPKMVDFSAIAKTPHTMAHVTDMNAAEDVLTALVHEMNRRMATFSRAGVRDIDSYNKRSKQALPRLLVVFDEFAAAMDMHAKALEPVVMVLLQQARASGIHFLLLLQRPDDKVLPTRMRNNLPVRIAFRVSDPSASRLILNDSSACDLLGRGDGLYRDVDGITTRIQSPLVTDRDIAKTLRITETMPTSTYTIDGLTASCANMPSFDGLSEYDAAILLCQSLEWISPKDLLEYGIVDKNSQAKTLIQELRGGGYIGSYDAAKGKSPTAKGQLNSADTPADKSRYAAAKNPVSDDKSRYTERRLN